MLAVTLPTKQALQTDTAKRNEIERKPLMPTAWLGPETHPAMEDTFCIDKKTGGLPAQHHGY